MTCRQDSDVITIDTTNSATSMMEKTPLNKEDKCPVYCETLSCAQARKSLKMTRVMSIKIKILKVLT